MIVIFSEEELEWIDIELFAWKVKKGCPEDIKKVLQKKLDCMYKKNKDYES